MASVLGTGILTTTTKPAEQKSTPQPGGMMAGTQTGQLYQPPLQLTSTTPIKSTPISTGPLIPTTDISSGKAVIVYKPLSEVFPAKSAVTPVVVPAAKPTSTDISKVVAEAAKISGRTVVAPTPSTITPVAAMPGAAPTPSAVAQAPKTFGATATISPVVVQQPAINYFYDPTSFSFQTPLGAASAKAFSEELTKAQGVLAVAKTPEQTKAVSDYIQKLQDVQKTSLAVGRTQTGELVTMKTEDIGKYVVQTETQKVIEKASESPIAQTEVMLMRPFGSTFEALWAGKTPKQMVSETLSRQISTEGKSPDFVSFMLQESEFVPIAAAGVGSFFGAGLAAEAIARGAPPLAVKGAAAGLGLVGLSPIGEVIPAAKPVTSLFPGLIPIAMGISEQSSAMKAAGVAEADIRDYQARSAGQISAAMVGGILGARTAMYKTAPDITKEVVRIRPESITRTTSQYPELSGVEMKVDVARITQPGQTLFQKAFEITPKPITQVAQGAFSGYVLQPDINKPASIIIGNIETTFGGKTTIETVLGGKALTITEPVVTPIGEGTKYSFIEAGKMLGTPFKWKGGGTGEVLQLARITEASVPSITRTVYGIGEKATLVSPKGKTMQARLGTITNIFEASREIGAEYIAGKRAAPTPSQEEMAFVKAFPESTMAKAISAIPTVAEELKIQYPPGVSVIGQAASAISTQIPYIQAPATIPVITPLAPLALPSKQSAITQLKTEILSSERLKTIQPPVEKIITKAAVISSTAQTPVQKQIQEQTQAQIQETRQLTEQIMQQPVITGMVPLEVPLELTPLWGKPKKPKLDMLIWGKPTAKAYKVELRRRGKFIPIGERLPIGRALELGQKAARESIAATFRIRPTAEITTVSDIPSRVEKQIFRLPFPKSKLLEKGALTLVQKAGGVREPTVPGARLASLAERSEIQQGLRALRKVRRLF